MTGSLSTARPAGVTFLAVLNAIGLLVTLVFWLYVLFARVVPWPWEIAPLHERINAATTLGFAVGDLAWSSPLLTLSALGLWRLRSWGWTAAQMTNALWIYSMTVVLIRDASSRLTPGSVLFTPFALLALWSASYLWRRRALFWNQGL
jgi:hypothetical protein